MSPWRIPGASLSRGARGGHWNEAEAVGEVCEASGEQQAGMGLGMVWSRRSVASPPQTLLKKDSGIVIC